MKKMFVMPMLLLAASALFAQQVDWKRFDRMLSNGEYKNVYAQAKHIYETDTASSQRLAAAVWMSRAAERYQEDAYDSAVARYRRLLPQLDSLHRALCYAFLGSYDTALMAADLLQRTTVEKIKQYCNGGSQLNMTPTAYDVVVTMMQARSQLTSQQRVDWQRRLCAFHAKDDDNIRIWHDLRLLESLRRIPNRPLPTDTVQAYINRYRGTSSPFVTKLYHTMAVKLAEKGDAVGTVAYCDTAVSLFPKSEGGVECANLRGEIKDFGVNFYGDMIVYPGRQGLVYVSYRNANHLWFRIIPWFGDFEYSDNAKSRMLRATPLQQWDLEVPSNNEYRSESISLALPALPEGRYILMVSPSADFKKKGFMGEEVVCTDMQLVKNNNEGLLLDRSTGRPIKGQEVKMVDYRYRAGRTDTVTLATAVTDADGRFCFDVKQWGHIIVDRHGYRLHSNCWGHEPDTDWNQRVEVRTDRPIYKPGDTVNAAVVYYLTNGIDAMAAKDFHMRYVLRDPNNQEVLTDSVRTDDFGIAGFQLALPKDRLPGNYRLNIYNYNKHMTSAMLRVEEYKQPKFIVTMPTSSDAGTPAFGKPYTVKGMAASYSAVPVSGAKVKYSVVRRQMHRWWWLRGTYAGQMPVADGEVTTAADGSFEITFTPEPDSSVELSTKPCFEYTIDVDVTDINGESHPAITTVRVGFLGAFIALDGQEEVRSLDGLKPRYFDLNGNPLPDDKVNMRIERLWQPATPLLDPPALVKGYHHTMSEADFRKAFPLYAYNEDWNNRDTWLAMADDGKRKDASGVYRITLTAPDADTLVVYRTVTAESARRVQSQRLLWYDVDRTTAEVGDTVTLRFGSRFKNVEVYYMLRIGNKDRDFRRIRVSDQLKTIRIPVDTTMLGGICIDLVAMQEGIMNKQRIDVDVPFSHKKLDVQIATFRDRLQPGETEEWTVIVSSEEFGVRSLESALVMTMYDDALNSYGSTRAWGFSPWRRNAAVDFTEADFYVGSAWHLGEYRHQSYRGDYPSVWQLINVLPYNRRYRYRTMNSAVTMQGNVRKRTGVNVEEEEVFEIGAPESGMRITSDDIQRMPGNSVESVVAAVGGIGYNDAVMAAKNVAMDEEEADFEPDAGAAAAPVQVRSNLNTLAFFVAGLCTDSTGSATYSFTVPELLTRWNVRGLAVTKDIKIGTLDKTLVTSKRLMVQPNMPRFLRSGDSLSLMAKVVQSEPSSAPQEVTVTFLLTDAATGDTICIDRQRVKVADAAQVMFDVKVPQNVYVATYEITAVAEGVSDGERGQIPVVSSRQAVTVSQAMYINGVGEKHYRMPEFLKDDDSRQPLLVAAEVTSNPIWLAVKCMPYLKALESPSTIYLANQYYVNTLGQRILKDLNGLKDFKDLAGSGTSRLNTNEDVKQTLMQATPWVQEAVSEEEQMAAVANYFDSASLAATMEFSIKQLQQRQNADGGWSWMPEGRSSVWTTQQVLKRVTPERFNTDDALTYIDREHQRYYEKYVKPNLLKKWVGVATDIDYLYTRSLYGKGKTEAYRYYYSNALKSYKDYNDLYTQAQLALIFHRNGDRKQALDLLHRIKQKSLESDEMGLYWRDNRSGWFWYQRPIETQALLIQAFAEITPTDTVSIGQMQQWLLKQKQTTRWDNDRSTTEAIAALMVGNNSPTSPTGPTGLTVFGTPLSSETQGPEGYSSQRWTAGALDTMRAAGSDAITFGKSGKGIAWGAVYYQFADDLDKIPASEMGITLKRSYIYDGALRVGDRVTVRIEISCDRAMEYLELVDGRPSCFEPLSTRAGWRWNDGLSYYVTVNNTDTRCYVEHIDKGKYVFEYEAYVTNPGTFMAGAVTMQCMYAPEFRAVSPGEGITVE